MSDDVRLKFTVDDNVSTSVDKISGSLDDLKGSANEAGEGTKGLTKDLVKGAAQFLASAIAVKKFADAIKYSIGQSFEAQKVDAVLNARIRALGESAGITFEEIQKFADGLQAVTIFGDETIKTAAGLLLSFDSIGRESIPRVVKASADLASAMGTDLTSATQMLGRALDNPIEGMTLLRRQGINLSKETQELVKSHQEAGDAAKAQAIILEEVERRVGGVAQEIANTEFGQWEQFKNSIDDIAQNIGDSLMPALNAVLGALNDLAQGWVYLTGLMAGNDPVKKAEELLQLNRVIESQREAINDLNSAYQSWETALINATNAGKPYSIAMAEANYALEGLGMSAEEVEAEIARLTVEYEANKNKALELAGIKKSVAKEEVAITKATTREIIEINQKSYEDWNKGLQDAAQERWKILEFMRTFSMSEEERETDAVNAEYKRRLSFFREGTDEYLQLIEMRELEIQNIKDKFREVEIEKEEEIIESSISNYYAWADAVQSSVNAAANAFDALSAKRKQTIEADMKREIEAVKNSRKSQRQKDKDIAKIEEEGEKRKKEIAMKDWRRSLLMSIANTALGITRTIANMGMPAAIPMVVATAATGAISQGLILANKPKFHRGGFVPGQSYSGDQVDIRAESGEYVMPVAQQRRFIDMAEGRRPMGGSGDVAMGDTNIVINGNATADTADQIDGVLRNHRQSMLEMLYEASSRGEIDRSRLQLA